MLHPTGLRYACTPVFSTTVILYRYLFTMGQTNQFSSQAYQMEWPIGGLLAWQSVSPQEM